MKKLFLLVGAMFLISTVTFAQSEKTVKSENKQKTEKVQTEKKAQPVSAEKKEATKSQELKTAKPKNEAVKTEKTNTSATTNEKKSQAAQQNTEKKKVTDAKVEAETSESVMESAQNQNGAEITFKETNHDFGTIPYKGNGSYEFVFVNTGNEPLILTQPKSSCGCTVPEWPRQPILPGESNVIKVTYKNTDRPGNFNKYVTVFSNALVNKEIKLHIKGTVEEQPTDAAPLKMEGAGSPVNKSN